MDAAKGRPAPGATSAAFGETLRQQQIHLVKRMPMMAQVNAFNASLVAGVVWISTHNPLALVWIAVMLVMASFQMLTAIRLNRRGTPKRVSGKSLKTARYWSAFAGLMWGGVVIIFPNGDMPTLSLFLAVVVAGMAAGVVMLLSPLPKVNIYFLVTCLFPLAFTFALKGDVQHVTLAALAMMFALTLYRASVKSYETLHEMVANSIERDRLRDDLMDAIESTNDGFALLDAEKRVVIANTRFETWFTDPVALSEDTAKGHMRQTPNGEWVYSTLRPTQGGGYVSVHADVTEMKRREEQLTAAKLRAEAADRAKTQFLASMSHELRTPLNAIIGFAQVLNDELFGALGDDRYKEFAGDIAASGGHLLAIINDILDLSKIESQTYRVECDDIDIVDAIEWAVTICEDKPENAPGRKIELDLAEDAEMAFLDSRALKRLLTAIIGNAVKFTPEGGRVGVRTRASGDDVVIEVWDEGVGIPEDMLEEVRKPFVQVENVFTRERHGSGLGLAISTALAKLMHCRLEMESVQGEGTTVRVIAPAEEPEEEALAA